MGHDEQLQRPIRPGGAATHGSASLIARPAEVHRGGRLTPRLAMIVLAIVLVGAAAGWGGGLVLPKTYGARAEILYAAAEAQQGGDPLKQDRQLSTQLVLLKSRTVLGPVAAQQRRQFEDLDKDVKVTILENSNVIQVEADASAAPVALETLQAVVNGYLALAGKPSGVVRNLEAQRAASHQTTNQLQTRVQQLTSAVLAGTATQTSLNDARAQLAASVDREKAIQARIDDATLTGQVGPVAQLLTPPYALPDAVYPRPPVAAGTGALVGLVVAGGMLAVAASRASSGRKR